jgi:hypothetical protein
MTCPGCIGLFRLASKSSSGTCRAAYHAENGRQILAGSAADNLCILESEFAKTLSPGGRTLDRFIQNPGADVRGTKMFVSVPGNDDRQNVIAYLKTLKP